MFASIASCNNLAELTVDCGLAITEGKLNVGKTADTGPQKMIASNNALLDAAVKLKSLQKLTVHNLQLHAANLDNFEAFLRGLRGTKLHLTNFTFDVSSVSSFTDKLTSITRLATSTDYRHVTLDGVAKLVDTADMLPVLKNVLEMRYQDSVGVLMKTDNIHPPSPAPQTSDNDEKTPAATTKTSNASANDKTPSTSETSSSRAQAKQNLDALVDALKAVQKEQLDAKFALLIVKEIAVQAIAYQTAKKTSKTSRNRNPGNRAIVTLAVQKLEEFMAELSNDQALDDNARLLNTAYFIGALLDISEMLRPKTKSPLYKESAAHITDILHASHDQLCFIAIEKKLTEIADITDSKSKRIPQKAKDAIATTMQAIAKLRVAQSQQNTQQTTVAGVPTSNGNADDTENKKAPNNSSSILRTSISKLLSGGGNRGSVTTTTKVSSQPSSSFGLGTPTSSTNSTTSSSSSNSSSYRPTNTKK